ncbi:MAG: hypothetical protein NOOUEUKL_001385 [Candidatus Fervidibacter sp.]
MYKSFTIYHFRCFRELKLEGLARFNLFIGRNNVGKTALLEALFIHAGAYNPELTLRVSAFRGIEVISFRWSGWEEAPWEGIFRNFDTRSELVLEGRYEDGKRRTVRIRQVSEPSELSEIVHSVTRRQNGGQPLPQDTHMASAGQPSRQLTVTSEFAKVLELACEENGKISKHYLIVTPQGMHMTLAPPPTFPAIFQSARISANLIERAERFGRLQIEGKKDLLLKSLQSIEPRLEDVAEVSVSGQPLLYGSLEDMKRMLPLQLMGEGMIRLTDLILNIANAPNGIVLVDEIETGFHYSVLPKVWQAIAQVAREMNTQIFATTHSRECLIAAHQAFSESDLYDFRLFRLEFDPEGEIRAVAYDRELLEFVLEQDWEVR